jgi:alpha-tubulin suppressor-like RCC1 family protein
LEVGSNWITLSCGSGYGAGIKADGSLWGWTFDPFVRIGPYTNPPVQLAPGTNWKAIAAGEAHALALRTDGTLWTWGRNEHGQVGDGTTKPSLTPKQLGTNRNWAMIAAGAFASLGIQADGTLWQWGLMSGDGSSEPNVPTRVGAGTNWVAIHTFEDCYYARDNRGWWRWGPGSTPVVSANRSIPVQCQATTNRVSVPNTRSPLLVVDQFGGIRSVRFGGSSIPAALKNVEGADPMAPISTQQDWIAAWAGFEVGFALRNDGTLWNWGFGQRFAEPSRAELAWRSMRSWLPGWLIGAQNNVQPHETMKPWPVVRFVTNSIPAK